MRAVLTFHAIDDSGSVLSFPPRRFASLIESLAASGTPVVTFDRLLDRETGITLAFDDGMRSVHESALPVLRAHGFAAHLFLTTGAVGRDNMWPTQPRTAPRFDMLTWDQVENCAQHGFMVEAHTATHPDLRELPDQAIVDECAVADDEIERRLGRRPSLFAYPYGRADDRVHRIAGSLYKACFSTRLDYMPSNPRLDDIPRLDTYFLRSSRLFDRVLSGPTRSYIALRSAIRSARGKA
jgi:peptidoglycan/xylan/chitin deacetylase (PgdA/CDA1 family)